MKSTLAKLAALEHPNDDLTLYEILRRNAGWGILWHSEKKQAEVQAKSGTSNNPTRDGLFVDHYYPTFEDMVRNEHRIRVEGIKDPEVVQSGLVKLIICAHKSTPRAKVARTAESNLCGASEGWKLTRKRPVPCGTQKDYLHYVATC
jgi:hypothetical protein